jgi:cell fate (sporulation/competence/biofilm development) regulator YmcA (YheA/YmcA/DUF963 family)
VWDIFRHIARPECCETAKLLRIIRARLRQLLDEKTSDHKRVSDDLREKSDTLAQLSLRVDTLSKRLKGAPIVDQSKSQRDTNQELVSRINTLEQQLRQEQEKNKRLKGQ